jgi:hypothetical protein
MSRPTPPRLSNIDEFPASYPDQNCGRMSSEAFAAALLGHRAPAVGAEFAETILREYDPDQPRDERGRWTSDGESDDTPSETSSKKKKEQKDLDALVEKLRKTDDGKKLYDAAEKGAKAAGADELLLRIEPPERLPGTDAAIDPRHGAIGIPDGASNASMLEGLLVELINMTKAKELVELQLKRIKEMKRAEYIEAMERLEFKSAQNAARIWKTLAKDFGQDSSRMPTYKNPSDFLKLDFKDHFDSLNKEHKERYGRQWDAANR